MSLSYILSFIGNISFVLFMLNSFQCIDITPKSRTKGNFIFSSISFFSYVILLAKGYLIGGITQLDDPEFMAAPLSFIGVFWLCTLFSIIYGEEKQESIIDLKSNDYKIVRQTPAVLGKAVLPIGQDFAYVNTYLQCNNGDVILLRTTNLYENHDLRCKVVPVKEYGDSVYDCRDLIITSSKLSRKERVQRFLTKWVILHAFILSVSLVPVLAYMNPEYSGGNPELDLAIKVSTVTFLQVFGGSSIKIGKFFMTISGAVIMITGMLHIFV